MSRMDRHLHVLVVEDKPDDVQLIARHLQEQGLAVHCHAVANPEDLKDAVEKGGWDVVLSDYRLPAPGFHETFRVLRERHPDLPLILVSGTLGEETAIEWLRLGVCDVVLKNDLSRLVPAIERTLRDKAHRRASEKLYRSLFDHMLNGFAYCRMLYERGKPVDFIYLGVNGAFETLTGLKDVTGKKVSEVIPGIRESDPTLLDLYGQVAATGKPVTVEMYIAALKMWFSISVYSPARDHFVAVFDVITERKRVEAELRQSAERYRTLLKTAMDGFWVADLQGHLLEVNETYCHMSGYSERELLTMHIPDLEAVESPAETADRLRKIIERGQDRFESRHRRKDGSLFDVEVSAQFRPGEGGRVVVFVRDVTREVGLQAQLIQAQKLESIGTLASGIAHDLNNILFPLLMGAQWLQEEALTADQRDVARTIETTAKRGAEIIKQILTFGRGMEGVKGPLQTRHVMREVLTMIRETLPRAIRIEDVVPPDLWLVNGNATQLHQVLLNLCVNARDAMPKGGTLTLRAANRQVDESFARMTGLPQAGPYVDWMVEDTGEGIPAEVLPESLTRSSPPKRRVKVPDSDSPRRMVSSKATVERFVSGVSRVQARRLRCSCRRRCVGTRVKGVERLPFPAAEASWCWWWTTSPVSGRPLRSSWRRAVTRWPWAGAATRRSPSAQEKAMTSRP